MGTGIQWTDQTWNPITGCDKISAGCAHCYATDIAKRFWGDRPFSDVQFHPERLQQPLRWRKPRMVFVNSMSDLFHESVTDEQLNQVFDVMAATQYHTYQILTKRPERMLEFMATKKLWPQEKLPNVWLGVTVENQRTADQRIPLLLQTPAAVRFLSCEPLLETVNLMPYFVNVRHQQHPTTQERRLITEIEGELIDGHELVNFGQTSPKHRKPVDWVIAGGESGPKARPCHLPWIQSIVDQCAEAKVPCFVKQTGSKPWENDDQEVLVTGKGGDPEEWARLGYHWPRQFPAGVETVQV
jgi:protein gp37